MDFSSALKQEIFRPGVTLLIPGIVAAFPFSFVTVHYFPELWEAVQSYPSLWAFLGFLVSLAFGLVTQDFGAQFEAEVIDKCLGKKNKGYISDWYRYLRCSFSVEPIGQRYIHDEVLSLKFELNTACALIICWVGLLWLYVITPTFSDGVFIVVTTLFLIAVVYLFYESLCTAQNLSCVRKELLKGVIKN